MFVEQTKAYYLLFVIMLLFLFNPSNALSQNRDSHNSVVRLVLDIPYVPGAGHKQQLDLFIPKGKQFPTLLLVHGGSLRTGDRKDQSEPYAEICKSFAEEGIACAAMSYRLFPSVDWPSPAHDVASAFTWLLSNIGKYGGDDQSLFMLGHSSGCTLVSLVAADQKFLAKHNLTSKNISGVLAMGCRLNYDATARMEGKDPELIEKYFREHSWGARFGGKEALASFRPMVHVGSHLPPILVLIAEMERFKPPILADAAVFVGAARDTGVNAEIVILLDRTHYSSIRLLKSKEDPTFKLIKDFIERLSQ